MGVHKLRTAAMSLALIGAATLTGAVSAPAQSEAASAPIQVSISATRAVTMPTTIQPGVNTFTVTTANKRGSAFQIVKTADSNGGDSPLGNLIADGQKADDSVVTARA